VRVEYSPAGITADDVIRKEVANLPASMPVVVVTNDQAIVNGVSRIGYMTGGRKALWVDEDIADVITARATRFIDRNKAHPFFLYFATHDIHVPRLPNKRFTGKTGMGPRGDAIAELDWSVGQVLGALDRNGLARNTLVIFSSDNGPWFQGSPGRLRGRNARRSNQKRGGNDRTDQLDVLRDRDAGPAPAQGDRSPRRRCSSAGQSGSGPASTSPPPPRRQSRRAAR